MLKTLHRPVLYLLCTFFLLSGCSLPSNKTTFSVQEKSDQRAPIHAKELLEQAVQATRAADKTQQFWFTGYVKNGIGDRQTTSMFDGVAVRPMESYVVNGRMAGIPFNYYRWDGKVFIKKGDTWFKASEEDVLNYDPFAGFLDWLPFLDNAYELPEQEVLSQLCRVIQVEISGKEWIENSTSPLFSELKETIANEQILQHVLENTIVKSTMWIGKKDHYLYQYSTWIVMPLPGSGYFDQETFFRFYKYSDKGVVKEIQPPEKLEEYVREAEERIKAGELDKIPEQQEPVE